MDPDASTLEGLRDFDALLAWCGFDVGLLEGFEAAFGGLAAPREVALLTADEWAAGLAGLQVAGGPAKPVHLARARVLRRVSRLLTGLPADEELQQQPLQQEQLQLAVPGPSAQLGASQGPTAKRIKLSAILDQTDDTEDNLLDQSTLLMLYQRYEQRMGAAPPRTRNRRRSNCRLCMGSSIAGCRPSRTSPCGGRSVPGSSSASRCPGCASRPMATWRSSSCTARQPSRPGTRPSASSGQPRLCYI